MHQPAVDLGIGAGRCARTKFAFELLAVGAAASEGSAAVARVLPELFALGAATSEGRAAVAPALAARNARRPLGLGRRRPAHSAAHDAAPWHDPVNQAFLARGTIQRAMVANPGPVTTAAPRTTARTAVDALGQQHLALALDTNSRLMIRGKHCRCGGRQITIRRNSSRWRPRSRRDAHAYAQRLRSGRRTGCAPSAMAAVQGRVRKIGGRAYHSSVSRRVHQRILEQVIAQLLVAPRWLDLTRTTSFDQVREGICSAVVGERNTAIRFCSSSPPWALPVQRSSQGNEPIVVDRHTRLPRDVQRRSRG